MSNKFKENDFVWAKMRGYPAWPAKVQKPPKGVKPPASKLYIFFYGSHNYAWMSPVDLFPYEEHKEKFRKLQKKRKGFAEAIREIEEDLSLAISSSVQLPHRKWGKKVPEPDSGIVAEESPAGKGRKRQLSSQGEGPPSKKSREERGGGEGEGEGEGEEVEEGEVERDMRESSASEEAPDLLSSQESCSQAERVTQGGMRMRSRSKLSPPKLFCPTFSPFGPATASIKSPGSTAPFSPPGPATVSIKSPGSTTLKQEPAEVDAGPPTDAVKRGRGAREKRKEKRNQSNSRWSTKTSDKAFSEKSTFDLLLSSTEPDSQSASTQEEEGHAKRYATRYRHTSGSSFVEQLTQNYMARKEQLGSPTSSPVPVKNIGRRLRIGKEEVEAPKLGSTAGGELSVKGEEVEAPKLGSTADSGGELSVKGIGRKEEVEMGSTAGGELSVEGVGKKEVVEVGSTAAGGGELSAKKVGRRGRGRAEGMTPHRRTGSGRATREISVGKKAIRSSRRIKKEPVESESVVLQLQPDVGSSVSADVCESGAEGRREEGERRTEEVDKDMAALKEAVVEWNHLDDIGIKHDNESVKECMESDCERGEPKMDMEHDRIATIDDSQLAVHGDNNQMSEDNSGQEHLKGNGVTKPVQEEDGLKPQTSQGIVNQQQKDGERVQHQLSKEEVLQQPSKEGEGIKHQPLKEEVNEKECKGVKHHPPHQVVGQQPLKEVEKLGIQQEVSGSAQNGLEASADQGSTVRLSIDELPRVIPIQLGMNTVEMLQAYNYNLMAAVTIESPNVHQAMVVLRDLLELQCTTADLEKVPNLVATIRKLRHYRASQKVIKRADEVYHKLKGLYLRPNQVVVPSRKRTLVAGGMRQRIPIRTVTASVATTSGGQGGSITDVTSHKPSVHQEEHAVTPVVPETPTVQSNDMKEDPPCLRRSSRGTEQDYSKMDQSNTESSGTEGDDQTVPT